MDSICFLKKQDNQFGVFANKIIEANELIGEIISDNKIDISRELAPGYWETIIGRYINHNCNSNTVIERKVNSFYIISNKRIEIGDEIYVNYKEIEMLLNQPNGRFFDETFSNNKTKNYGK